MQFKLVISLGNDAMQDATDVASALEDVAYHVTRYGFAGDGTIWKEIFDANGNHVGHWTVEDE